LSDFDAILPVMLLIRRVISASDGQQVKVVNCDFPWFGISSPVPSAQGLMHYGNPRALTYPG